MVYIVILKLWQESEPSRGLVETTDQALLPEFLIYIFSKLGKEYVKAAYCHLVYLTYMQSTSCEIPGWMNHKLESRLLGEISTDSNMQMMPF